MKNTILSSVLLCAASLVAFVSSATAADTVVYGQDYLPADGIIVWSTTSTLKESAS